MLVTVVFLAFVSLGLPDGVLGIAWPSVRDSYGLGQASYGILLIGAGPGYFLSGLTAGRVLNGLGLARTLVASTALAAAGLSLFGAALPWPGPIAALALVGLGSGTIDAGINAFASARFSARQVNWLHASYSAGAAVGPGLMTVAVTGSLGWTGGYFILAGALAALTLVFGAAGSVLRMPPSDARASGREVPGQEATPNATVWDTLRHPLVPVQTTLFFVYTALEAGLGAWGFTIMAEARGLSSEAAGLAVAAYFAAIFIGRVALGFFVEQIGADRLVRGATVGALVGALAFAAGPAPLAVVGLAVAGLSLAPVFPTLISRTATRLPPDIAIHAVGLKVSGAMIGGASGPIAGGLLAEWVGLGTVAPLFVGLAVLLVWLHERLLGLAARNVGAF